MNKKTNNFIQRANTIHKNKYNYSLVNYKTCKDKVTIVCPEHGSFKQSPDAHTHQKQGCPKCKNTKLSYDTNTFIKKAKEIHGDKYDYSLVDYKSSTEKVKIVCNTHGVFLQRPSKHISNKRGCPLCGKERIKTFQENNYVGWSYTDWEYAASKSKNFDSFKLYIIKCWNEEEEFYKIGKTYTKLSKRFDSFRSLPYSHQLIKLKQGTAIFISELEKELHKLNKNNRYKPKIDFAGSNECFTSYKIIEKAFKDEQE